MKTKLIIGLLLISVLFIGACNLVGNKQCLNKCAECGNECTRSTGDCIDSCVLNCKLTRSNYECDDKVRTNCENQCEIPYKTCINQCDKLKEYGNL